VGVFVRVLQVLPVHVLVRMDDVVVRVLVVVLDVRVVVRDVGVLVADVAVAVLVRVRGLGHHSSNAFPPQVSCPADNTPESEPINRSEINANSWQHERKCSCAQCAAPAQYPT
jgi:hypothetical protein